MTLVNVCEVMLFFTFIIFFACWLAAYDRKKRQKSLVILRHVPGAGSTTFGNLIGDPVSADQFFEDAKGNYNYDQTKLSEAHTWCANEVAKRMKNQEPLVVVANTFVEEWQFSKYIYLAKLYNYKFFSLIVENRHGGKDIHNVPPEVLEKMRSKFEIKL